MPKAEFGKTLKNSHGGYAGRTLIQRLENQMDKRRKVIEQLVTDYGVPVGGPESERCNWHKNQGRYEGLAAALAIMRSTSVEIEVNRSNERLGID